MEIFAENLRTRIAELGFTHAEVARRCDLEIRRFHHYVVGDREPDLQTLIRIAQCLATTPDALLGVASQTKISTDEASQLRAKLGATMLSMDPSALRLLSILADGVIGFVREEGASTVGRDGRSVRRQGGRRK